MFYQFDEHEKQVTDAVNRRVRELVEHAVSCRVNIKPAKEGKKVDDYGNDYSVEAILSFDQWLISSNPYGGLGFENKFFTLMDYL